jgi:LytS/YehU family sensor histidine kinase
MKLIKPNRLELYSFLFSMPLIAAVINFVLYEARFWQDYRIWVYSVPLIFVIGVFSWYGHVVYADWVENHYPELTQSRERAIRKALVLFLVMIPSVFIILFIYHQFNILGYQYKVDHLYKGLLIGLSVNLIFQTLYEAEYIFTKMKESCRQKETLQELAIYNDFDALKNQVNPHFLFNCFNTLSSLIGIDKARAEAFLDELCKVYRYLLKNNQEGLSTVASEVSFIESYYRLLQTRYGDAIQINIQIDKRYDPYLLPSLSLQLLVENVVKHNELSKSKPVVIDIFTTVGNKLVVNNNLQRLRVKAPSNKVGLKNIRAKYALLNQVEFQVMEDAYNFTVVLPLMWQQPIKKAESVSQRD